MVDNLGCLPIVLVLFFLVIGSESDVNPISRSLSLSLPLPTHTHKAKNFYVRLYIFLSFNFDKMHISEFVIKLDS